MIDKVYNSDIINYNSSKKGLPPAAAQTPEEQKLLQACREFETVLIKQMLSVVQTSSFFGEGFGGEFFKDMFQEEIAKSISAKGLGLADTLYSQLVKTELLKPKETK
ncbi:MAG TPA: rod-binding protein [Bacillota bacterium]|jgi:Rod binding domain-containing protein|nr:rod-binding protein [Bacillota bacterium]HOL08845.1 rod-binding protein [Bacillota bacterium]HPO96538.1 rod-binding protein [Bacillota bacterium]